LAAPLIAGLPALASWAFATHGPIYVDERLGFSLRLAPGWTAEPQAINHAYGRTSEVALHHAATGTMVELSIIHGADVPRAFAERGTPNARIGGYPAFFFPTDDGCQTQIFLAELDYGIAKLCGAGAGYDSGDFYAMLASYKPAAPAFRGRDAPPTAVAPETCGELASEYASSSPVRTGIFTPVSDYDFSSWGTADASAFDGRWGHALLPGVSVCENFVTRVAANGHKLSQPQSIENYSGMFQCVELTNRFIGEEWGLPPIDGNAGMWFDYYQGGARQPGRVSVLPAGSYQLSSDASQGKSAAPPQAGDLLIFQDVANAAKKPYGWMSGLTGTGHVAVITSVEMTQGTVSIFQENYSPTGYYQTLPLQVTPNGWHIADQSGIGNRITRGWIHITLGNGAIKSTLGDLNGDGKADVIALQDLGSPAPAGVPTTAAVEWLSGHAATPTYHGQGWSSMGDGEFDWTKAKWVEGDFNGDGYTDLMAFYDLGSPAPHNVPTTAAYEWLGGPGGKLAYKGMIWSSVGRGEFNWARAKWIAGDFNGDGYSDVLAFYDLGTASDGSDITGAYEWLGDSHGGLTYRGLVWKAMRFSWATATWVAGDFNGDGYDDALAVYDLGKPPPDGVPAVGLYEWQGGSGGALAYQGQVWSSVGHGALDWSTSSWIAGDFNGDGHTDLMAFADLGKLAQYDVKAAGATTSAGAANAIAAADKADASGAYEWLSTDQGALSYQGQVWTSQGQGAFVWANATWIAGDLDGSGRDEVMAFYNLGFPAPAYVAATEAVEWQTSATGALIYKGPVWSSVGHGSFDWSKTTWLP
jgi:hypothetical protein